MSLKYQKPINEDLDKVPAFLRQNKATKHVSPASFNTLDSFKKTLPAPRFFIAKGTPRLPSTLNKTLKTSPGVGHYDLSKINKGFDKITLGASKGWK